jgi:cytochrome c oxidase subunit 4
MAEPLFRVRTYVLVCGILILLTFLTVGFSFLPVAGFWHLLVGLLIGLCKATLVALFFMHVIVSPRLTWMVIIVTCFWYSILVVLTLTDYFSRNLIPHTPGH